MRDRHGTYLSPIGSKAVLKSRSSTVTRDELFSLEDSLPQASFIAALNNKYVSVKQGVDVTANQDEIGDNETFQLEYDWSAHRWGLRTTQDRYWCLSTGGGIQATGNRRSADALFELVWYVDYGSLNLSISTNQMISIFTGTATVPSHSALTTESCWERSARVISLPHLTSSKRSQSTSSISSTDRFSS